MQNFVHHRFHFRPKIFLVKKFKKTIFTGRKIEKYFNLNSNGRGRLSRGSWNVVVEFLTLKTLIECQK